MAIAVALVLLAASIVMLWLATRAATPLASLNRPPARALPPQQDAPASPSRRPHAGGASIAIIRRESRPAIVLVHGILGFDALALGPVRVDYFRRVAARLGATGLDVIAAKVPPLGGVPERAEALARTLEQLPHDRVTLVAHSMGGLDARWAIANGLAPRVTTLVTLGTPHRGTPIADLLVSLGLRGDAVEWLTTRRLARFADEAPDSPSVRYACVIAATADRARVHPLLRVPHAYLSRASGASDGLVPASSQRWGDVLHETELDHWAQVGWGTSRCAAELVLDVLARLDRPALSATGT